ncbi:MAG: effector ['Waltheria sp.' little leaf phytoplasma]|nr:effector ['Waltheria sp.' little leaf phytoplasma]
MNQKNFLQKYFIEIMVILILGIAIIIAIRKNRPGTNQNQPPLSSLDSRKKETLASEETEIEKPLSDSPKLSQEEPPIPKIKTTAARLEEIKNYLFSEPTNPTLLPNDLSEREQEEINKLKKSWGLSLGYLNKEKDVINKEQNKCDEYQSQLNLISTQITFWEQQKLELEKQEETKEKELDRLKINRKINEDKIKKLQEELIKIVTEISEIKSQIGILKADRKYYQGVLTRAEEAKKESEERYEFSKKERINSIIFQLNELYDITSAEG